MSKFEGEGLTQSEEENEACGVEDAPCRGDEFPVIRLALFNWDVTSGE